MKPVGCTQEQSGVLEHQGTVIDRVDRHLLDLGEGVCLSGGFTDTGLQGMDVAAVAVVAQLAHLHRGGQMRPQRWTGELGVFSKQGTFRGTWAALVAGLWKLYRHIDGVRITNSDGRSHKEVSNRGWTGSQNRWTGSPGGSCRRTYP